TIKSGVASTEINQIHNLHRLLDHMQIKKASMGHILTLLLLSAFASGCGGDGDSISLSTVNGIITYQQKPLAGAQVLFTPEVGPAAIGETDEQGEFTLKTRGKE